MTTEEIIATASKYILGLLTLGGGAAGVAFFIMKSWGKGWLDNHFNKRLELFKHEQTKEIERIKAELNTTFDRAQRLHQWEFEALPEVWSAANEAYGYVVSLSSPFRQYADISRMTDKQLDEFLTDNEFRPSDVEIIKSSERPQDKYNNLVELRRIYETDKRFRKFTILFRSKRIFIDDKLCTSFDTIVELMNAGIVEAELNYRYETDKFSKDAYEKLTNDGKTLMLNIEADIKRRLQYQSTTPCPASSSSSP
ncbi:hypothetical protein JAU75_19270 [Ochrobactrum sp. Q0168]|uniref:hypothetical protein n=1 Tax=Ochrobactrum sp. Q0168 TaxID=2793241 RepID=UPI0018EAB4EC|nr:hypothetical protein [Ochrobactrum sp. Q0168]